METQCTVRYCILCRNHKDMCMWTCNIKYVTCISIITVALEETIEQRNSLNCCLQYMTVHKIINYVWWARQAFTVCSKCFHWRGLPYEQNFTLTLLIISFKFLSDCLVGYLAESHWNLVTKFDKSSVKV